jgi:hypothetical protein
MKRLYWTIGLIALALLGIVAAQGTMGAPGGMGMGVYAPGAQPITLEDATRRADLYASRYGQGAKLGELMVFADNLYGQVVDASTGAGLAEFVVDRYTGFVRPEPGPNMHWNTRSAQRGAMMGNGRMMNTPSPQAAAPVRYAQAGAQRLAETFLTGYLPGAKVLEGQAFPGYYTFDYGRRGIEGMLSVNVLTGEVWVHTWHGPYIADGK